MKNKEEILLIARSWIGTKWMHNQRLKGVGVDCVNFLYALAEESNYPIAPIPKRYGRLPIKSEIKNYLKDNFEMKSDLNIDCCDVLLFNIDGRCSHVALATSTHTIIHANQKLGYVVEHNLDGVLKRKLDSVFTVKL